MVWVRLPFGLHFVPLPKQKGTLEAFLRIEGTKSTRGKSNYLHYVKLTPCK
jgi:hypothetical protein